MTDFGLQAPLDHWYAHAPRRLALRAETLEEFMLWRNTLREEVMQLLRIAGRTLPAAPRAERLQVVEREGYTEEKWTLDVGDTQAPVFILVPNTPPPYKPILALHGHSSGVQNILGNYPDKETYARAMAVDNNYAQVLAQAGYLVCAVEQRGFGERISDQVLADYGNACRHLSFEYLMQGRVMLGERLWDAMCTISLVQNRPDVVPGVFGCTGNSGGGTTTLWLSALDERVTVAVPGSYFCSFKRSILGMRHCECNYVPGILQLGEMGDLAALIAPRAFRAIAGEQDHIYPIAGAHEQFETVQRAYDLLGHSERCSLAVHPGGHAYNHEMGLAWFAEWL